MLLNENNTMKSKGYKNLQNDQNMLTWQTD
mgnify:CR=1 FL=1